MKQKLIVLGILSDKKKIFEFEIETDCIGGYKIYKNKKFIWYELYWDDVLDYCVSNTDINELL